MLNKVLLTLLLIAAAFYILGRIGAGPRKVRQRPPDPPAPPPFHPPREKAHDLVKCKDCGAYVDPRAGGHDCRKEG